MFMWRWSSFVVVTKSSVSERFGNCLQPAVSDSFGHLGATETALTYHFLSRYGELVRKQFTHAAVTEKHNSFGVVLLSTVSWADNSL